MPNIKPCDPLIVVQVALRGKCGGIIERTDVNLDQWSELATVTLPSQRRATLTAEATPDAGGRFVQPTLTFGEPNLILL